MTTGGTPGEPTPDPAPSVVLARRPRRRGWVTAVVVGAMALAGTGVGLGLGTGSGAPDHRAAVQRALRPFTVKPLDLAQVMASGSTTAAGAAGSGTTTPGATGTLTLPARTATLPPSSGTAVVAPPGFRARIEALYAQIDQVNRSIATGVPGASGSQAAPTPAQFDQAVQLVPAQQLATLYSATVRTPEWSRVPGLYAGIAAKVAAVTPAASPKVAAPAGPASPSAHLAPGGTTGQSAYPYPSSSSTTTFPPATTATTDPSVNSANCPAPAPGGDYGEDSIYAAQLALDAFVGADSIIPKDLTLGAEVLGEGDTSTFPDPAWIVVQALVGAAEVTHDTLAWRQAIANDCNNADTLAQTLVIDGNVDYLTGLVDSRTTALENEAELIYALVDSQTTLILNQLAVVQATINLQIKVVIEQDLLQGTAGAVAELEQPASQGGYLDAVPIGVEEIVTGALASMRQAGQAVNPAADQDLASAEAALSGHRYKQSFALFSQAYQEIVQ